MATGGNSAAILSKWERERARNDFDSLDGETDWRPAAAELLHGLAGTMVAPAASPVTPAAPRTGAGAPRPWNDALRRQVAGLDLRPTRPIRGAPVSENRPTEYWTLPAAIEKLVYGADDAERRALVEECEVAYWQWEHARCGAHGPFGWWRTEVAQRSLGAAAKPKAQLPAPPSAPPKPAADDQPNRFGLLEVE